MKSTRIVGIQKSSGSKKAYTSVQLSAPLYGHARSLLRLMREKEVMTMESHELHGRPSFSGHWQKDKCSSEPSTTKQSRMQSIPNQAIVEKRGFRLDNTRLLEQLFVPGIISYFISLATCALTWSWRCLPCLPRVGSWVGLRIGELSSDPSGLSALLSFRLRLLRAIQLRTPPTRPRA